MVMKFFPHIQNCGPSIKMPKNRKNNFGNIFKIFFKNRRFTAAFRRFSKNISTIFGKYFENVPKIIFSIFLHFYTRPAILYVWKKFHNHSFFPSYFFHHLKIGGRWHISYPLSVLGNVTHMYYHTKFESTRCKNVWVMPITVYTYKCHAPGCHTPFDFFANFCGGQCELPCKIWSS